MDTTRPVYVINSPSATENAEDPFRMRVRRHNNTVIHSRGPSWCCFCFTGGRRSLIRGLLLLFIIAMLLVIFGSDSGKRVADNPGIGKIPDEKRVANIQAPIHISSAGDTKWDGGREEYDEPTYRDTINDFDPNDDYGVTSDASVTQLPGMVDGDTDDNIRVADTHYREKLEQIRQQEEEDLPEFNADWFLANDKSTQTVDHATVRIATTNIVPSTEESLVVTESPSNLALNYAVQEDLTPHKQGSADSSELYEEAQRGNLVQSFTQEGGSINPIHLDSLTTEKPQDITQESPESPVHESQALLSVPAVGPAPGIASSLSVPEQMNPIAPQSTASEAQSQQVDTLIVNVSLPNASRNVARPLGDPQREILINSSLPQDSQSLSENVENISDEYNSINQEEVQFAPVDSIRSQDQNSPNVQVSVEHTKQNVISPAQSPAFIVPGTEIALGIKPYVPASRNEQSVIPEEITQDTLPPPVALNETSNTEASFGTDNAMNQLPVASNAFGEVPNIDPNSSIGEPNTVNQLPVASNALEGSPNIDPNSSIREPNTVNQLPVASNALEGSPNIDPNSSIREPNTVNQLPVASNALEGSPNIDPNSSLGEPNTVNQLPVAFNALEGSPNIDSNSSLGEPNTANQLPAAPSTFGVVPKIDPSSSAAETNTVNQIPSASDGLRELPSPDPKYSLEEQNQVQSKESDLILSNEFHESTAPNNILGMSNSVGREPIVPDDAYLVSGVDMNYESADSEDSTNKAYLPHVTKTPSDYTFESLHSLIPDFNMPSVTLPPRTYEGAPPAEMFKNIQSQLEGLKNIHSQIDDASQRLKDLMAAHHSKIMGHLNDEDKGENIRDYSGVTHSLHQQDMTGYAASNTGTLIEEDTSKDVVTSVTEDPSDVTQATKFNLETNDGPTFVEMNQSRIEEKIASGEGLSEEALRKMEEIQENKKEALLIEEEEPRDMEIENNKAQDQTMAVKVTGGKGTDSISEYFIDNDLSNNDHKKQEVISDVAKKETKIEPPKDDDKEKSGGESDDLIADSKEEENNSKNENERKKQEAIQDVVKEETKIEPQKYNDKEESRGESDDPIAESKKEKDSKKKKNEQQEGKKKSESKDEEPKEKPDAKTEKNDKAELELLPQKKIVVKEDMTDEESEFNFFRSTEQVHVACDNYGDLWTRKPVAKPFCLSYDFTIKAPCTVFFASSGEDRSFEKIASKLHECSVTTCYRFGKSKESCDVDSFMKKLIEEENGVDYLRLDLGYDLWSFLRSSYLNDSLSNVKQLGLSLRTTNAPYNKVGTTEPTKEELFHYYQDLKYLEDLGFLKWYSHDERRYLNISRHYPDTYISTGYDLAYINRNFARGSNLKIDKQPSAALSELLSVIEKDDYECKNNLMKKHRDDMDWDVCLDKDLVTKNDCHVFIIDAHDNGRSHWTMADALRNNFGCEEHVYLLSSKTDAAGYIPNDEPIYPGYNVKYLRLKGQRLKSGDVHVKDMQLEDVIRKTKVPGVDILKIYIPLSEPKIMENIVEMDAFDDIKQIILNLEINESQATTIPSDKDYELFIEMLSSLRDMGIEQWRHTTTTRVNSISTGMTTTVYQLNFVNTNAF